MPWLDPAFPYIKHKQKTLRTSASSAVNRSFHAHNLRYTPGSQTDNNSII